MADKETEEYKKHMLNKMGEEKEEKEFNIAQVKISVPLTIPQFLLPAWRELRDKPHPTLSQDAAMLWFAIKAQLTVFLE